MAPFFTRAALVRLFRPDDRLGRKAQNRIKSPPDRRNAANDSPPKHLAAPTVDRQSHPLKQESRMERRSFIKHTGMAGILAASSAPAFAQAAPEVKWRLAS